MYTRDKTFPIACSLGALLGLAGCGELASDADESFTQGAALDRSNGLAAINGLGIRNGLAVTNGLAGTNGLAVTNGLAATNGLASTNGLMTRGMGRRTVAYLSKCALGSSQKLTKQDQYGNNYTFKGDFGLAQNWLNGGVSAAEQQAVSACMMAHLNTAGVHVPIWVDSGASTIGWGRNSDFPNMEGTFFGNVMSTGSDGTVPAYFCEGTGFSKGIVPGRMGARLANAPYRNPWGDGALCDDHCTKHGSDGYTKCDGFDNPVTVWRKASYDPVFDDDYTYKLVSSSSDLALDVLNWSTANGAALIQWSDTGGANQQFQIIEVTTSQWKIVNVNSGKALTNRSGTAVTQNSFSGAATDLWIIDDHNGHFKIVNKATGYALKSPNDNTAAGVVTGSYSGADNTDWDIFAVDSLD